jgi:hypothetical protein
MSSNARRGNSLHASARGDDGRQGAWRIMNDGPLRSMTSVPIPSISRSILSMCIGSLWRELFGNRLHKAAILALIYRKDVSHMSIALRSRQMFLLFLLALVTIFLLGSILLNAVAHVNVWQIMFSSLKSLTPGAMYGQ